MDVSYILDDLNKAQRTAVSAEDDNILILAGAGSGKTRVLVHRIAWYIATRRVGPFAILAVTFTNKGAAEMRARTEKLLGESMRGMWMGTFHGIAHRLLRANWQVCDLLENFQILDNEDQRRTIRRVIRTMELDEARFPPREVQWFINAQKDQGLRPNAIQDNGDGLSAQMVQIYHAYQQLCNRSGLVDFPELLLRAYELFNQNPEVLAHYQQRFKHILVDEFQDTNALQYAWLRLLTGEEGSLFAVGDDDQSIYGWRGACVGNMQQFKNDFSGAKLLRLEQNYRSTATVLEAANALIANNSDRLGKQLWTSGDQGDCIDVYMAYNERDEVHYVLEKIQSAGQPYNQHAILYRVSAQSRHFEDRLMANRIPYRVYGGMRFYERAEIKDALAYLRLVHTCEDDTSFERIINMPPRGIGLRTLENLRALARERQCALWQAAEYALTHKLLGTRALSALEHFLALIIRCKDTMPAHLHEHVDAVIRQSGLIEHFQQGKGEKDLSRIENLQELVNAARDFERTGGLEETDILSTFLAHAALESGETQADDERDFVHLMTLHAAKGLEFPHIYIVGVEEGLLPHQRSSTDVVQLEEERRLCYVGITRAKRHLTMSYAQHRRLHRKDYYPRVSRFIKEIPAHLIKEVRLGGDTWQPHRPDPVSPDSVPLGSVPPDSVPPDSIPLSTQGNAADRIADEKLSPGQRVRHAKFGEGVVLNLEAGGGYTRVQVNFRQAGCKWLIASYANLQAV